MNSIKPVYQKKKPYYFVFTFLNSPHHQYFFLLDCSESAYLYDFILRVYTFLFFSCSATLKLKNTQISHWWTLQPRGGTVVGDNPKIEKLISSSKFNQYFVFHNLLGVKSNKKNTQFHPRHARQKMHTFFWR